MRAVEKLFSKGLLHSILHAQYPTDQQKALEQNERAIEQMEISNEHMQRSNEQMQRSNEQMQRSMKEIKLENRRFVNIGSEMDQEIEG